MAKLTSTQRKRLETRVAPEEDPEFQIAPMIDILLVLLVFFMSISSTEVLQSNKNIQLPVAAEAKDAGENPGQAIVNVLWSGLTNAGTIEIDEKKYPTADDIIPELQKRMLRVPTMRVLVRADRGARYEYLRTVLKAVGDAGVSNVTFSVVDKEVPATAP